MVFKNFIFDIDGTLIDSYNPCMGAMKKAIYEVTKHEYSEEEYEKFFTYPFKKTLSLLNISKEEEEEVIRLDSIYEDSIDIPFFEGVENVLKNLKINNCFIAYNTSRIKKEIYYQNVEKINKYSSFTVTSDMVIKHKPDPESLELIIKKFNLKKEETLMIGDSDSDGICAKNCGVTFALAGWGAKNKNIFYDIYLENPNDILNYVKK